MADGTIKIKLMAARSARRKSTRRSCVALGLKKMNRIVVRPDTPGFRGMVAKIPHLLADREGIDSDEPQ